MANHIVNWAEIAAGLYPLKLIDNGDGSYSLAVSSSAAAQFVVSVVAGDGITVDNTDPENPEVSVTNPSQVKVYTPTLTPCSNTTTPTNILAVTIPANDWADGEKITVDVIITGTTNIAVLQLDMTYGTDTYSDISGQQSYTQVNRIGIELWRLGSTIYVMNNAGNVNGTFAPAGFLSSADGGQYTANGTTLTSVTFNSQKDLVITATFDTADAGDSVEILTAKVVKI